MEFAIGIVLAVVAGASLTITGMDRDRAVYPVILIVIASFYVLFAVMGASTEALVIESAVAVVFAGLSVAGFRSTLWLVVAGLAAHGVFDLVHARIIRNPGVPAWWPMFCLAYDVTAALYLVWLISHSGIRPTEHTAG